jgi:hypothetical protein
VRLVWTSRRRRVAVQQRHVARRRRSERGQAVPLLAGVLVMAAALAVLVADLGVAAVHRARAQAAADAAALAGAADGRGAAVAVAAAQGGTLLAYRDDGRGSVELDVGHGPARARATAEATAAVGREAAGVAPALAAALARAGQLLGRPVPVVGVAPSGLAVEVAPWAGPALAGLSAESGLCPQPPEAGPVHFVPCLPTSPG